MSYPADTPSRLQIRLQSEQIAARNAATLRRIDSAVERFLGRLLAVIVSVLAAWALVEYAAVCQPGHLCLLPLLAVPRRWLRRLHLRCLHARLAQLEGLAASNARSTQEGARIHLCIALLAAGTVRAKIRALQGQP